MPTDSKKKDKKSKMVQQQEPQVPKNAKNNTKSGTSPDDTKVSEQAGSIKNSK